MNILKIISGKYRKEQRELAEKTQKKELEIKYNLESLLITHIIKVWDKVAQVDGYQTRKALETIHTRHHQKSETDKEYYSSSACGFSLFYMPESKSYQLILHIGTSSDLEYAILSSIKKEFNTINRISALYSKGFNFQSKIKENNYAAA